MAGTTYTAYAGDTLEIAVTVTDEAGAALPLTGAALVYVIYNSAGAEKVHKVSGAGITTDGNVATIAIAAGDTALLERAYHELQVTDTSGNVSTLLAGPIRFDPTRIP